MSEGRKTRTKAGHMTEKQKLDREWQKISQVIIVLNIRCNW